MKKTNDLSSTLKELRDIVGWFESQEEVDIEVGLKKVKEAASLLKLGKERLKEIENEFEEVKKDISKNE